MSAETEKLLEKILEIQSRKEFHHAKLLEHAKNYALVHTYGYYMENGLQNFIGDSDKELYEKTFINWIRQEAVRILQLDHIEL
jgi:hypothetical protein